MAYPSPVPQSARSKYLAAALSDQSKQPITSAPQLGLDLASQALMQHAMGQSQARDQSMNPGPLTMPGAAQTTALPANFNANRLDTTLPQSMGSQGGGGFDLSKLAQAMKFFGGG